MLESSLRIVCTPGSLLIRFSLKSCLKLVVFSTRHEYNHDFEVRNINNGDFYISLQSYSMYLLAFSTICVAQTNGIHHFFTWAFSFNVSIVFSSSGCKIPSSIKWSNVGNRFLTRKLIWQFENVILELTFVHNRNIMDRYAWWLNFTAVIFTFRNVMT